MELVKLKCMAGMYGTAEQMNGRTRLHRCQEGIPVNNGTRIEGVLVRIGSRRQDKMSPSAEWVGLKEPQNFMWKYQPDRDDSCT